MTYTVLYVDSRAAQLDIEQAVGPEVELINARQKSADAIDSRDWERSDAIITARMPIDTNVIPRLKRARIVVRHGVGFDVVDLESCGAAGIAVCNVPDYGTTEVADSAIAMMLAFARGTPALDAALRADLPNAWSHTNNTRISLPLCCNSKKCYGNAW